MESVNQKSKKSELSVDIKMKDISREITVFFYCYESEGLDTYQHSTICLAEGLRELGIKFYSNINYWKISPDREDYLFHNDPQVSPNDCSIVIMDNNWFIYGQSFPANLFHSKRKYITVYFEHAAAARYTWKPELRQFDFIFRSHYNRRCRYPLNVYPWAFGLSERIIRQTQDVLPFSERRKNLLVNFRIHNHPLRSQISQTFFPEIEKILPVDYSTDSFESHPTDTYDYLLWVQSGKRHYPSYFQRLKNTIACACFGGLMVDSWPPDPYAYDLKQRKVWERFLNRSINILDPRPKRAISWESYRFWEALSAGCVPFHVDFEKYGIYLPVMPENWRHYIGVDLDNVDQVGNRIEAEPEILENISIQGRQWALDNYSPRAIALRFLETIK